MSTRDTMLRPNDPRWREVEAQELERRRADAREPVEALLRRDIGLSRVAAGLRRAVEESSRTART